LDYLKKVLKEHKELKKNEKYDLHCYNKEGFMLYPYPKEYRFNIYYEVINKGKTSRTDVQLSFGLNKWYKSFDKEIKKIFNNLNVINKTL
jgi:hypothetical protein